MTGKGFRRLIHAGSAIILVIPLVTSWNMLRAILVVGTAVGLVFEIARIKGSLPPLARQLSPLFRPGEANRPSGAWWLSLAYTLAAWLPQPGAAAGIMVGALADPAASMVGSYRPAAASKTVLGSGAAFAVATIVLALFGLPWLTVSGAALIGTVLERWPGPLDDNLLIAPGVAAAVWLLP